MEVLNRLLTKKFEYGMIGYHPMTRNLKISNLSFADELMVFYDGKLSSLQGIQHVLDSFHLLSGLVMNKAKTQVYTAGLNAEELLITGSLGFTTGTFPFRYLGLPLLHRKLKKSDYSPLLDQLNAKFHHWSTKTLSFEGRLQLISSVVFSLINFWMSTFSLPKCCLKTMETLCNRFLWSGDIDKSGGIKVSWQKVCLPKAEGGLGLWNL